MQPVFGLYTHIRANRIRSALLLIGLFAVVYGAAFVMMFFLVVPHSQEIGLQPVYSSGVTFLSYLPFITLGVMAWLGIGVVSNQAIVAMATDAKRVERKDELRLYNLLENLCISRGVPMPLLAVVDTPVLNAFASGLTEKRATVTVTRGLMDTLNDSELEAVLAHELTHIRNRDTQMMMIAVVIVGGFAMLSELLFRFLASGTSSRGSSRKSEGGAIAIILIAMAVAALGWLLSSLINFAISRSREYLADAGAVELTKNPDAMIDALLKISGNSDLENVATGVMQICFDNPRHNFFDLFSTHPSIQQRVEALIAYGGGSVQSAAQPAVPMVRRRGPWDVKPKVWPNASAGQGNPAPPNG